MTVYNNILELIGNTPIIKLNNYEKAYNINSNIYAKLEFYNPGGSSKDRIALEMIQNAEEKGIIQPKETIIVEPTSGNTGIGIALVGKIKGYKVIITMPENMSKERVNLLKAYGAEVILTNKLDGMKGSIDKANEILNNNRNVFIPSQFTNISNVEAHYKTTGPEIWNSMNGNVDIFITTIGTGGTLTGTAKYLKEVKPDVKIIGVEPEESPIISKGYSGMHGIQGIGANFIPDILDTKLIDEIITVNTEEAYNGVNNIIDTEGIFAGISSGAVIKAIEKLKLNGENVVTILPDRGERYLSQNLFAN